MHIKPGVGIQLARDVIAFNTFQSQKNYRPTTRIICSPPAHEPTNSYNTSFSNTQLAQTISPQNILLFATQDESQQISQFEGYNTGFEDVDMEQYEDGLIISKEDDIVPTPIPRQHTASWVRGRGIDTQQLEDLTDSQREAMGNTYMAELELNDLDAE